MFPIERQSEHFAHLDEHFIVDADNRREASLPDESGIAGLLAGNRIIPGMLSE